MGGLADLFSSTDYSPSLQTLQNNVFQPSMYIEEMENRAEVLCPPLNDTKDVLC